MVLPSYISHFAGIDLVPGISNSVFNSILGFLDMAKKSEASRGRTVKIRLLKFSFKDRLLVSAAHMKYETCALFIKIFTNMFSN